MSVDGDHLTENTTSEIEYTTSNFHVHWFNATILDKKIAYQIVKMVDSLLIFINDKSDMQLSNMFVSLPNRCTDQPIGTKLFGDFMEESSKVVSTKISKKLNKAVYVSCNLEEDRNLIPLIEKRIFEEINKNPNVF